MPCVQNEPTDRVPYAAWCSAQAGGARDGQPGTHGARRRRCPHGRRMRPGPMPFENAGQIACGHPHEGGRRRKGEGRGRSSTDDRGWAKQERRADAGRLAAAHRVTAGGRGVPGTRAHSG